MDNASRPFGSGPGGPTVRPGGRPSGPRTGQTAAPAGPALARSLYQQRLDQIKVRIVELSHRNMEGAMRVLRDWLADKGDSRK